jgi:hypothetical protein
MSIKDIPKIVTKIALKIVQILLKIEYFLNILNINAIKVNLRIKDLNNNMNPSTLENKVGLGLLLFNPWILLINSAFV